MPRRPCPAAGSRPFAGGSRRCRPQAARLCRRPACFGLLFALLALAVLVLPLPVQGGCLPRTCRIALDAGHGPKRSGAVSARGIAEYDYNTHLVGRLRDALTAAGFARPILINELEQDLPPAGRAKRANAARACLLLSIHHDAVQPQFLDSWNVDGQERRYCDQFAGYSLFYSGRNARADTSLALARRIGGELRAAGLPYTRHHAADIPGERKPLVDDTVGVYRYDGLAVLGTADMPAVLVEAGVIVHRKEEIELAGTERQQKTAAAVARAVAGWCAAGGR